MSLKRTILILDDEKTVLDLTARYLNDNGYTTFSSRSSESATERFHEAGGAVDLLIANVTLAGESGVEIGLRLQALAPKLKIVFMSGLFVNEWNASDLALVKRLPPESVRILLKPFSAHELLSATAELIGTPANPKPETPWTQTNRVDARQEPLSAALDQQSGPLDEAHDAVVIQDLEGRIRFWNQGAEDLYGWAKDQAMGRVSHELLHSVFPVSYQDASRAAVESGHWEGEVRQTTRRGVHLIVSSHWSVHHGQDGQLEVLAINWDITSQKRVEEGLRFVNQELESRLKALRRVEARFRGLLESAPDAMVIVDRAGRITMVNQQAERQFGYTREELNGQSVDLLVPEGRRNLHAHRDGYVKGRDLFGVRKNGEEFPVEISLSSLDTDDGLLISSSIRDISERRQFENLLSEKNLQLEAADKAKDLFLAGMSHELRSPLQTIIGFGDLLAEELKGSLNDDQRKYVRHILDDSRHLLALINDILDLSKIEAGGLQLRWESFDTAGAIEEVISLVRQRVEAKSIRLETSIRESLQLHADYLRFKQVLYNLLSNAIKFTPNGGHINIEAKPTGEFAEIAVTDNGIGIPDEQHEAIFNKFHQLGAMNRGYREGTGLRLPITRALVENHGGRIWLKSKPGQGSCFAFTIPTASRRTLHAGASHDIH